MALVTRSEDPRAQKTLVTRSEPKIRLGNPVSMISVSPLHPPVSPDPTRIENRDMGHDIFLYINFH